MWTSDSTSSVSAPHSAVTTLIFLLMRRGPHPLICSEGSVAPKEKIQTKFIQSSGVEIKPNWKENGSNIRIFKENSHCTNFSSSYISFSVWHMGQGTIKKEYINKKYRTTANIGENSTLRKFYIYVKSLRYWYQTLSLIDALPLLSHTVSQYWAPPGGLKHVLQPDWNEMWNKLQGSFTEWKEWVFKLSALRVRDSETLVSAAGTVLGDSVQLW